MLTSCHCPGRCWLRRNLVIMHAIFALCSNKFWLFHPSTSCMRLFAGFSRFRAIYFRKAWNKNDFKTIFEALVFFITIFKASQRSSHLKLNKKQGYTCNNVVDFSLTFKTFFGNKIFIRREIGLIIAERMKKSDTKFAYELKHCWIFAELGTRQQTDAASTSAWQICLPSHRQLAISNINN